MSVPSYAKVVTWTIIAGTSESGTVNVPGARVVEGNGTSSRGIPSPLHQGPFDFDQDLGLRHSLWKKIFATLNSTLGPMEIRGRV
jgi:hypothetical protein